MNLKARQDAADDMNCRACGGLMLIVDGFLVCEHGCGRLIPVDDRTARLWPERVIEARPIASMVKRLRRSFIKEPT